ncbi:phosphate ABC transporter permease subunit PstC [Fusobacterium mortiferum]|uniref:phosphate ABC transporter permease subunit PstC n=1 Tax=Fusobacterium mortiferum TaxID=850 RepID=UPI00195C20F3|nr:phosphate ABC transporter permease subunit PstC [Fusobacterium mortiferum]
MIKDSFFKIIVKLISIISFFILFFVIIFIIKEALPLFQNLTIKEFIMGDRWRPISAKPGMGIFNIIVGTIYVGIVGVVIALPFGIGVSIFLSCITSLKIRKFFKSAIDLLAGIPSVIYGFMGLIIVVKIFENFGRSSGESVLAGGIVLAIMLLPFMVSVLEETMTKLINKYEKESISLGVSKQYLVSELVLPLSIKSLVVALVLSFARALGETMAVMMVIGNAPIFPKLLGKTQTISSLIALEMGMVEVGSLHYSALFASAVVLMLILIIINIIIDYFRYKFIGDTL